MKFTITNNAVKRIAELITKEPENIALRVKVDGGGCSGFQYDYQFIATINQEDIVIENNGVKVAIDPLSQQFLDDCTLDFIEELVGSHFQINNPNATAKCGCGNSFSV
ncbi:MAG: iron-sulfur cluster insertion protein ErpA [Rickettsiaceae bacterium]|nr:iron-sulfur cluster insertion protein ErpA [Rickettsiaceae bacterium]